MPAKTLPFDPAYDVPLFYCPVCARELRKSSCGKCGTEDNTASNWIPNGRKQRPTTPPAPAADASGESASEAMRGVRGCADMTPFFGAKHERGLYGKFRVERTDGKSAPGQKHDGCRYFVLDLDHDTLAPPAIRAYAKASREAGYVPLADDLDALYALPLPAPVAADRPEVVCLCGSTRFIDTFAAQYGRLTDEGKIVLTVGRVVPQSEQALGSPRKAALDTLHLRKIDLADRVLVLNVGGYVGPSTRREIEYAKAHGKPIDLLFPHAGLEGAPPHE